MSRKDNHTLLHTHIGPIGLYWLIKFITTSCRVSVYNGEAFKKNAENGRNMIIASWHNRLFTLPYYYRYMFGLKNLIMMVSKSRDGEMFKRLLAKFDIECVRGSTTRGGISAVKSILRETRKGRDTAIALDGSKGPRYVAQPGSLFLAQMTGMPIMPVTIEASRKYEFNTWDRMAVPKPFSHIHGVFGEPIYVPRDASDLEPYRLQLQEIMDRICAEAEKYAHPSKQ
jgi:lysophospholipid acyltransferase (LPLAT)-like uncharacterized protein